MKIIKDLSSETIESFRNQSSGELVFPNDANYNEARKVCNGMIDKKTWLFAMCLDVADVMVSVNFGRENNLLIAIKGGGHNGGGLG